MSQRPNHLPVPNPTPSYWRSQPDELDNHQTVPELPSQCDILIVGGGYVGVSTAYHLLKAISSSSSSPKPRVVLLEARNTSSGATGRNGGHLRPDLTSAPAQLLERYGPEAASAVAQFEVDHMDAIAQLVREEQIDCDFTIEPAGLEVFTTKEQLAAGKKRFAQLRAHPASFGTLLDGVRFYEGDDAPAHTGVRDAKGYFVSRVAHLSPYKFTLALLSRALELGLVLKTHTPVLSIAKQATNPPSQHQYLITTPHGTLTTTQLILATNAYTSALLPEYSAAIIPCRGLACHISPAPPAPAATPSSGPPQLPQLRSTSLCLRVATPSGIPGYHYLIQRPDAERSIVVGGAHHTYKFATTNTNPEGGDQRGVWYNTVDDASFIERARAFYCNESEDGGFMARTFGPSSSSVSTEKGIVTDWATVQTQVDHVWTGIMGYSADSLPHIGEVPGREGVFVLAGFHGHGMPVGYLAAKGVVEMVVGGKVYEETGLPGVYKTTGERLKPVWDDILGDGK
ncbi:FAD dependent oxidoreductase [Dichotomopilus funicola]|uniref:FAD dependent oxidoreductase n=1 Tax=Dichotomopilus funicola TaxID=1934379 RepID=A0AAN6ZLV1_9PEZI|nr:FAD dependent oxidoreductase [Dichotomopilus funicola]